MGVDLIHIPKIFHKEIKKDESECYSEPCLGSLIALFLIKGFSFSVSLFACV